MGVLAADIGKIAADIGKVNEGSSQSKRLAAPAERSWCGANMVGGAFLPAAHSMLETLITVARRGR